jgi:hypothetical protein
LRISAELAGRRQMPAPVLQQLAVALHGRQALVQRLAPVRGGQAQVRGERIGVHRTVGRGEYLQDRLAAGDGFGIALGLASGVRIAEGAPGPLGRRTGRLTLTGTPRWRRVRRRLGHPRRALLALSGRSRCGGLGAAR